MQDFTQQIAGLSPARRALLQKMLLERGGVAPMASIPRRQPSASTPLSFAQQRLWFLDRMGASARIYNLPVNLRLRGQLNAEALRQALGEIVQRHESLRTAFHHQEGEPYQEILAAVPVELPLRDLSALGAEERQAAIRALTVQENARAIDLSQGRLFRARLLRLHPAEHLLLVTMHHIASDGWSIGVFMRELAALYGAFAAGGTSPLAELPIQYADYAVWQQRDLEGEKLDRLVRYWREQLAPAAPLQLPVDRARRPVVDAKSAAYTFRIPAEIAAGLEPLRSRGGATLFMVLLAAFQVLLHRYTGSEHVPVGTPVANRSRSQVEGLIGFFVNTLVLCTSLEGDPTFTALLARVRETVLGAFANQDLPFEKLVEELQPERDMTRNPFFQVMFVLQQREAVLPAFTLPDLEVTPLDIRDATSRFDLELHLWETPEGITGYVPYSADLFDEAGIANMMDRYRALLGAIAATPDRPISELFPTGRIAAVAPPAPPTATIVELFEAQALSTPDSVALVFEDRQVTYRALNRRAAALAGHLQELGVGPEAPVALCAERGIETIVALLAILKAGGAYVPLDPGDPPGRIGRVLAETGAVAVLVQARFATRFDAGRIPVVTLDSPPRVRQTYVAVPLAPENLAYIMYTSGSTGAPKGVSVTHQAVVRLVHRTNYARLAADEVFLQFAPLAFDAATFEIWGALLNGARLVIPVPGRTALAALGRAIGEHGVTTLWLTAGLFRAMVDEQMEALMPVRQLLAGGDVLPLPQVEKLLDSGWTGQLINGYGPTENTTFTCCFSLPHSMPAYPSAPIGHPIRHTEVYILDGRLEPAPDGVPGDLYAGGVGLARGYCARPDLTAAAFTPNPYSAAPGARMYRTGDVVRRRSGGEIEFIGRRDRQTKLRGFRVEPAEIESALTAHPAVASAMVVAREVAREDGSAGKHLIAYAIPAPASALLKEIGQSLAARQVASWEAVFEKYIYSRDSQAGDPLFNTMGWRSSYDRNPIPESEMREWAADIVGQVRALRPRRVLEIGCGAGMLLFQIAPGCEAYHGTDFSEVSLDYVRQRLAVHPLPQTTLSRQAADDFTGLAEGSFDCVILSSIVQYFPNIEYLIAVLEGGLRLLRPGGFLFLGDLRNHALLEAFHTSVQVALVEHGAEHGVDAAELRRRIDRQMAQEKELLVDPALFPALRDRLPAIRQVQVRLQRGRAHNELTKYRYHAVLHTGEPDGASCEPEWRNGDNLNVADLRRYLETSRPEVAGWIGLRNARLSEASGMAPSGIDPQELWELGTEIGYSVELCWSAENPACLDAAFARGGATVRMPLVSRSVPVRPWSAYANNPLQAAAAAQLVPLLRAHLEERLPGYMVPSAIVLLGEWPLTRNGKIDRAALLAALPAMEGRDRAGTSFVAPRNAREEALAKIWADLLGIDRVGVNDNFFSLGGHSLLATQVISRIRQRFLVELPLPAIFESPTIAGLADALARFEDQGGQTAAAARIRDQIDSLPAGEIRALLQRKRAARG
jgi:amino acid adenylation domain-containing protein